SHHKQVASPAACSREVIVIVGPVPFFNCTTSPSLNACMRLLLSVCDEVYRPNSTQLFSQRDTPTCILILYPLDSCTPVNHRHRYLVSSPALFLPAEQGFV